MKFMNECTCNNDMIHYLHWSPDHLRFEAEAEAEAGTESEKVAQTAKSLGC